MKKFFKEFSDFIRKGNVIDLAVGIIIGGAFNSIVKSLVNDIAMPLIGLVFKVDVTKLKAVLVPAVKGLSPEGAEIIIKSAVELRYGSFIQAVIDFLVISFTVFVAIKAISFGKKTREKIEKELREKIQKENTKKSNVNLEEDVKEEKPVEESKPSVEDILLDIKNLLEKKE